MAISSRADAADNSARRNRAIVRLARDWQWWCALGLGALFWAGLYLFGGKLGDARWPLQAPWLYLKLALLMPLAEELVFRGMLQSWLLQRRWGRRRALRVTAANAVTSLAFSAAHFFYHTPLWAAAVFAPSLVFGYFRERHASVLPAVLLHAAYNAGYFLLFFQPVAR